ncbi:membrane-bound glycerophospholipid O-acyltransferase 2-like [Glandiceps talaboti]
MVPGLQSVLSAISDKTKVPYSQVSVLFFQVLSIALAIVFKYGLHPNKVSPTTRHVVTTVIGLYMAYYCHEWSILHTLLLSTIAYIIMKIVNPRVMPTIVLAFTMVYINIEHLRKAMKTNAVHLDHVTSLMVTVQRVTSLAFGLHDGLTKDLSELNPKQRQYAIKRFPSIVEYYSYIFHFQGYFVGPFCFFNYYKDFMEGKHLIPYKSKDRNGKTVILLKDPSVAVTVIQKLFVTIGAGVFIVCARPYYPIAGNVTDAICNASGFGFNGLDEFGQPEWDVLTYVPVYTHLDSKLELSNTSVVKIHLLPSCIQLQTCVDYLTVFGVAWCSTGVLLGSVPSIHRRPIVKQGTSVCTSILHPILSSSVYFCGHISAVMLLLVLPATKKQTSSNKKPIKTLKSVE